MSRIINSETSIRYARLNMIRLLRGRRKEQMMDIWNDVNDIVRNMYKRKYDIKQG